MKRILINSKILASFTLLFLSWSIKAQTHCNPEIEEPQLICNGENENCEFTNLCPLDYFNLDELHTDLVPEGHSLVWSTDNTSLDGLNNISSSPTTESGVYYAYYYNLTAECFSPASNPISVTIEDCPVEICDNRIDDDGDGLVDCMDPDCSDYENCWECLTDFYQIHSNQYLVSLDPVTGVYNTLGNINGASDINGAQFNPIDGHVYAPCKINGEHLLGTIYPDGTVESTGLSLPGSGIFYVGAISELGVMYISNSKGIHSIDLTAPNLEVINTGVAHPGVADFALDITNGLFYGITGGAQLKVFDPFTNQISTYPLAGSINSDYGGYGACWSCNDGSFFAYNNNSGKIYTIDTQNLTATQVLNATGNLSINDGFNCVLAPPPFESNCGNGIDDDGDGLADCDDNDCYNSSFCTVEICNNGIDDDNDGWTDCSDSECYLLETCLEICDNDFDDNGNGLIDGEDPQCGTSSGVSGGLESNRRLASKIAQRNFETKVNNSFDFNQKEEGILPYHPQISEDDFEIRTFIPIDILDAYIAESTPIDLIDITNATDVAAADYYVDNQRIASVLGIYSQDGVYEHSKYICDRLDGSRLLDISYLFARGGNFISYELLNEHGQKEYAVSFAATYKDDQGFAIESHWNLYNYSSNTDYYNFQIWAISYEELIILLESIIDKMDSINNVESIQYSAIPRAFIISGRYKDGALELTLRNKNNVKELNFQAVLSRSENGMTEDFNRTISLDGLSEEFINIPTGKIYDIGASISTEGSPNDEIFFADGSWGPDINNPNVILHSFNVQSDDTIYENEVFPIERTVQANAEVKDYFNIYRSLDAKINSHNLNQYNALSFSANGFGQMEITLVKESIELWEDQYRTQVTLNEETLDYNLIYSQFSSTSNEEMDLEDINMIVFTLLGNNSTFVEKSLELSNVRFETHSTSNTADILNTNTKLLHPNPVENIAHIEIINNNNGEGKIEILDINGKTVISKKLNILKGTTYAKIDVHMLSSGMYLYQIENKNGIVQKERFLKL